MKPYGTTLPKLYKASVEIKEKYKIEFNKYILNFTDQNINCLSRCNSEICHYDIVYLNQGCRLSLLRQYSRRHLQCLYEHAATADDPSHNQCEACLVAEHRVLHSDPSWHKDWLSLNHRLVCHYTFPLL